MSETTSSGVAAEGMTTATAIAERANGADDSWQSGQAPRGNALRHGLTATKLLPSVLRPGRLQELKARLGAEYQPRTITEELYLNEIARHAAALEITEQAEPAVLRKAALGLSELLGIGASSIDEDLQLATAITAEPLDRVARYRRGHEKALHQAIEKLKMFQATGAPVGEPQPTPPCPRFETTEDCEKYLQARFAAPDWKCPRCKNITGHWLEKRMLWECAQCHAQIGLRFGSIFARSPLPLTTWFLAIRCFAGRMSMTAQELATLIGLKRLATAREMLRRMRCALEVDVGLLVGLTTFALPPNSS